MEKHEKNPPRRRLGRGVPTAYLSPGGIAGRVPDASVDVATSPPATRRELRALARGRLAPRFASRFPTTFTPEVFQDKNRDDSHARRAPKWINPLRRVRTRTADMRVESASALTPPEMFLSRLARVASSRASSSSAPSARRLVGHLSGSPRRHVDASSSSPRAARASPFARSLRRRRHTARANVPGDSGVANPGLDAARLLIRGEGVSSPDLPGTLVEAGLTPEQADAVVLAHPQLVTDYSLVDEIQPRVNYLRFLHDNDRLGGESVAECILRQPQSLERRFGVAHEDADYVVVDKPWCVRLDTPRGWPGKTRFTPKYPGDLSVEDWLERRHPDWDTVRFCHQLDNATSGVLVAASNKRAAGAAAKLFRERRARKTYLAIVFGHPKRDEWTVDVPLGRDPDDPKGFRERVELDPDVGKACETRFRVLSRGTCALEGKFKGAEVAKVEVTPVTGRRHQIRVHLKHSGHPIVGDNAYSDDRDSFRTFLHARALEMPFPEPRGTERWVAPEPESFAAAMVADDACARKEP